MSHRHIGRGARGLLTLLAGCVLLLPAGPVLAHHGVAGLGAAGLEGPGAPVESTTSSVLPQGRFLGLLKLDHARYETFDSDPDNPESEYANFWLAGAGYGFTSWFSGYLIVPYHEKVDEPGGFTTRGFADVGVLGQIGFKHDEGLRLVPENESLDDLEDWHFTVFGGLTLPTGDPDLRDRDGNIDPGKSTSFGEPSYSLGATATAMFSSRFTFNVEASTIWFEEHEYADGNRTRFGTEYRLNTAFIYRVTTDRESKTRLDVALEPQYLSLGRDETNGEAERATGGEMIYLLPGVRGYYDNMSGAIGVKFPVYTNLNEEDDQQGGEGTEEYRLILSFSILL